MATISEDYVSFETAKLLKEKGFNEDCWCWYEEDGYFRKSNDNFGVQSNSWHVVNDDEFNCSAPTLQMAMKWLREVHNTIIIIEPHAYDYINEKNASYVFSLWQGDSYYENPLKKDFPTYEQTVEAAIKCCLEKI